MKSPFPGMDPYLERPWRGFHTSLLVYLSEQLNARLPQHLVSRIGVREYVASYAECEPDSGPDGYLYRTLPTEGGRADSRREDAAVRPLLAFDLEPVKERFLNIIECHSGDRVVTTIELLSPINKRRGTGREMYLRKQDECRAAEVNLVEIDLIRSGRPTTVFAASGRIPKDARASYHVSTLDFAKGGKALYFRMPLREPLPKLPIPLRAEDAPAVLDLQEVIDTAYARGYCWRDIDYSKPATPPLPAADAGWAGERIAAWRAQLAG